MRRTLLIALFSLIASMSMNAQRIQVVDQNGHGIPFVHILTEDGTIIGGKEFMQSLMDNEDYKGAFKAQESSGDGKDGDDGKGGNGGNNGGTGGQQGYQSTTGNIYTGQNKPKFSAGTNGGVETGGNAPKFNFGFTHIREPEKK